MTQTRRTVTLGLIATALASCGVPGATPAAAQQTTLPTAPNAGYDAWVANFRTRALNNGIRAATFDAAFANAGYLPGVVERDGNQIESRRTFEDYLAIATTPDRVAEGRRQLSQRATLMGEIEARFGVPAPVFTAIWGMESNYGRRRGNIPTISALSTLAYDGRRGDFYRQQLLAALRILQNGDVTPANMTGSWAGAMGHTQFIPTSYEASAVDFRGDGRRDIWSEDPTDGLASAAAYLANAGWRRGERWGREVPPGESGSGQILQPGGAGTPRFEVRQNYRIILRYNNSSSYGIAVGHLSDRLAGGGPLLGSFGADANGLTLPDRIALQRGLTAAGYDTQGVDGVIGNNTLNAIRAYETANGLPVTGTPSTTLLARLR
jgi:lytic murein transglycosylase